MSAELEELQRMREALQGIEKALGTLVAFALPTLDEIAAKLPTPRRVPRRRRKRAKRKRGLPELLK